MEENERTKTCPFLSAKLVDGSGQVVRTFPAEAACTRDDCAWWYAPAGSCAMVAVPQALHLSGMPQE